MQMRVAIGDLMFKTKSDAYKYIRTRLHEIGYTTVFYDPSNSDYVLLMKLLRCIRPDYPNVPRFKIVQNQIYGSGSHIMFINKDGDLDTFSWRRSCGFAPSKACALLREIIWPTMIKYREGKTCELCHSSIGLITHHKNLLFKDIVSKYIATYGIPETKSIYTNPYTGISSIIDSEARTQFLGFHNSIATLQVLCQRCHTAAHSAWACK